MIEREFINDSADRLLQSIKVIELCLGKLTPVQLWARHSVNENAIGNLMLHLAGNLRQYIIAGLGEEPDIRVRAEEFSTRAGHTPENLLALLRSRVDQSVGIIRNFPEERLAEQVTPPGRAASSAFALITHIVTHFVGHTYQIIYATKLLTSQDLAIFGHAAAKK